VYFALPPALPGPSRRLIEVPINARSAGGGQLNRGGPVCAGCWFAGGV
jgi:hypothetical protein